MNSRPVKRTYDASKRQAQARQLRLEVAEAGRALFVDRGYAATTIADVAQAAGVSTQFIFKAFTNKAGLLAKIVEWTLAGDDEPVPLAQRPSLLAVRAEPSAGGKCALFARHNRLVAARVAPTVDMLRGAADADPDVRAIYDAGEAGRRMATGGFVADVASVGPLRAGLSQEHATDAVWALMPDLLWTALVGRAGWSPDAFELHYATLVGATLLDDKHLPAVRRFSQKLLRSGT